MKPCVERKRGTDKEEEGKKEKKEKEHQQPQSFMTIARNGYREAS